MNQKKYSDFCAEGAAVHIYDFRLKKHGRSLDANFPFVSILADLKWARFLLREAIIFADKADGGAS